MRIIFDVDEKVSVVAGSEPWRGRVDQPPLRTFKANVTIILPQTENIAETVEFEGDSANMLNTFRLAVAMLENLQQAHEKDLDASTQLQL